MRPKPIKNLGEKERGRTQGLPKFFEYPLLSKERVKLRTSNVQVYSQGPSEQNPLKFWEKMERGHIQGLPQFFEYPILSQERVKLRTSNLAGILTGSMRTKSL